MKLELLTRINTDILNLSYTPIVLALFEPETKVVQVVSSARPMAFMEEIMYQFRNNIYKNKALQTAYNRNNKIEIIILETVNEITEDLAPFFKTLLLKIRTEEWFYKLKASNMGYNLIPLYNPMKVVISAEEYKKQGVQILVHTARNKRYYVQRSFSSVSEAEEYVKGNSKFKIVKDTGMVSKLYIDRIYPSTVEMIDLPNT